VINFRRLIVSIVRGNRSIDTHHATDYERWREVSRTTGTWNPTRAERIAAIIPEGVHVLDLGAGSLVLKRYLKTACTYTPSDLHDRGERCVIVDLNKYEFPEGNYDWVTVIGVVEYLKDPRWVLARAARAAPRVIVTYNTTEVVPDLDLRRGAGWICHLSHEEFVSVLREAGFTDIRSAMPPLDGEIVMLCE
jgi:hypothetical protein